ncbi:RNA polymerase sigma factor [Candidatus Gottesmanbacteria bacterium]|nr:RNA polymerase sigma factor [Candidatus Gottesmanbacteria bacterium]
MNTPSDAELVSLVKNGNILAFEQFVKRYEHKLISFSLRFVGDIQTAEEIAQDALFLFYKHIQSVDTSKKISTYLFEITKNRAISELRKKKQTTSLHEDIIENREDFYESAMKSDVKDSVYKVLRTLDRRYRSVLEMYYLNDVSYEEIAHSLNVPKNTVRTWLKRGKEVVKKIFYEKEKN